MRLALYQPDIPQNTGTILRLAACLSVGVDVIEPAGFDLSSRALRRAGLDYLAHVRLRRHPSFDKFLQKVKNSPQDRPPCRLVLVTTAADVRHTDFRFKAEDILLLGRESAGVPEHVHQAADARIAIPMAPGLRSLNVAMAAALVLGEGLRQCGLYPAPAKMAEER